VAARDKGQQKDLTESTGTGVAEGAGKGAVGGGVLGGIVGLLAGVGALVIPGIGPIIAGGALASTLAGTGSKRGLPLMSDANVGSIRSQAGGTGEPAGGLGWKDGRIARAGDRLGARPPGPLPLPL